jgi:hypothetical protein
MGAGMNTAGEPGAVTFKPFLVVKYSLFSLSAEKLFFIAYISFYHEPVILTSIYKIHESNHATVSSYDFLLSWQQMLTSYIKVGDSYDNCHIRALILKVKLDTVSAPLLMYVSLQSGKGVA